MATLIEGDSERDYCDERKKQFHLNTKGCCLLCLNVIPISGEEGENVSSISLLLRYLKINMAEVLTGGSSNSSVAMSEAGPLLQRSDVEVQFCGDCGKLCEKTSEQIQIMELLRMELNYYFDSMRKKISEANENSELVRQYQQRISSDIYTLVFRDTVNRLRERLSAECSRILSRPQPTVTIYTEEPMSTNNLRGSSSSKTAQTQFPHPSSTSQCPDSQTILSTNKEISEVTSTPVNIVKTSSAIRLKKGQRIKSRTKIKCDICLRFFKAKSGLSSHYKSQHAEGTDNTAPSCKNDILQTQNFTKPTKQHRCTIPGCSKSFPFKSYLLRHLSSRHSISKEEEVTNNSSEQQLSKFSSTSKIANEAPVNIPSTSRNNPNVPSELAVPTYTIVKFPKSSGSDKSKIRKKSRKRIPQPNWECCKVCGKAFATLNSLNIHHLSTHLGIRHHCNFPGCSKSYCTKRHLKRHQLRVGHHVKTDEEGTRIVCKSPFNSANLYINVDGESVLEKERPSRIPSPSKKYMTLYKQRRRCYTKKPQCTICLKTFTRGDTLNNHMRKIHGKPKSPRVGIESISMQVTCGERNDNSSQPKKTLTISHDNKDNKFVMPSAPRCNICQRTFKNERILNVHHRNIHLKGKTKECEICKKTFTSTDTLKEHRNAVHLGIRLQCHFPGCLKRYNYRDGLRKHLRREHSHLSPSQER